MNDKQLAVLRWIADGCPDGVMQGDSCKISAAALKSRRLITITKTRGSWSAAVTEAGAFFLAHGRYPDGHWRDLGKPANPYREQRVRPVTAVSPAEQLVADVQAAGGRLDMESAYRHEILSLIASANRFGKVAPGFLMRWEQGKSWGRGTVALVPLPDWVPLSASPVAVPAAPRSLHPAVECIKATERLLPWAKPTRARALRLLHALCVEADRRGYGVRPVDSRDRVAVGLIKVEVHGHGIALTVHQLDDRIPHEPTKKELQEKERYSWTRIPKYDYTPSGRLRIDICTGTLYQQDRFADAKRHQLEDRLGSVLFEIELRAAKLEQERLKRQAEAAERQLRWQDAYDYAVEQAREDYRWEILEEQEKDWRWHQRMTAYVAALQVHVSCLKREERQRADEWVAWARRAVESQAPFAQELSVPPDPEITPERLQPHMPGFPPRAPD